MKSILLIPDTSVLFYYIYGNLNQKSRISEVFDSYNKSILINQTIKSEIGRTIFLSYFLVKEKIVNELERIEREETNFEDFWKNLNFSVQKSTIYAHQEKNRIFTILANIQDKLNISLPTKNFEPDKRTKVEIERIEIALFQIENELFQFQKKIHDWEYWENFRCHQTNWEMVIVNLHKGFDFSIDLSCSKSICPDKTEILKKIYIENKDFIHKIIRQAKKICEEYSLDLDSVLLDALKNLKEEFERIKRKMDFKKKICWKIGDFLIALDIDEEKYIFTVNTQHFLLLLIIKELTNQLIEFDIEGN